MKCPLVSGLRGGFPGGNQPLDIITDLSNRPDFHGLLLLILGQFGTQHLFDLQQEFNGIDAVKTVNFPEIVIQSRIFNFKILAKHS